MPRVLKSHSAQFWVVCSLLAIASSSISMLEPLVPLFAQSLGATPATIGEIVSAAYLLPLLFAMPIGNLVDQVGAGRLITGGAVVLATAPSLVVAAPTRASLLICQVLMGLAQLALVVSAQTLVGSFGTNASRERSYGWYTTFLSAGQFLGPLVAGVMIDATSYRSAFALAGFVAIAVILGSRFVHDVPRARRSSGPSMFRVRQSDLHNLATRPIAAAVLLSFAVLFSIGAFTALLPVYLRRLALSATTIGLILSLRPLTALLLRPLLPTIVRWFGGRSNVLVTIVSAIAAGMGFITLGGPTIAFLLAALAVGAGWALSQPLSMAMLVEQVSANRTGLALGFRLSANRVAQFTSPIVFGAIAQLSGFAVSFATSAGVALAIGAIVLRLHNSAPVET